MRIHKWAATAMIAFAILGFIAAGSVSAQESAPAPEAESSDDTTEYVEVNAENVPKTNTITTKLPISLQETPAHVGVVGSELMWEQGNTVLSDTFRNVSGVNAQQGTGIFDFYYMRGFDSQSGVTFLIDGVVEPESSTYHLYNAAGVEVLKGPGGFLYGSTPFTGALAGTVNLVRKQPLPGNFGAAKVGFGTYGTYEGSIDWNTSSENGKVAFRLNGMYWESERFRNNQDSQQYALNPSIAFNISDKTSLNVNLEFVDLEFQPDTGIPLFNGAIPSVPAETSYQSGLDFSDQQVQRVQVDLEHRFNDRVSLRNKTYYRSQEWDTLGTLFSGVFPFPPNGDPFVGRILNTLDDDQTVYGNQLEIVAKVETGAIEHQILAGVELLQFEDDFTIQLDTDFDFVPLNSPVPSTGATPSLFTFQQGETEAQVVAPYLIDQMKFNDKFQFFIGARLNDVDFEDAVTGTDRSDSDVSPMLGFVVSPRKDWSIYGNAGETFAPASPRVSGPRNPEESRQYELGLKKQFADGRYRLSAAVYSIERENIAIPDDNGITQQAGDQESEGFELEFTGELTPGFRLVGTYAYNDSTLTSFSESLAVGQDMMGFPIFQTFDRSGNTSAFAPENLMSLWVAKDLPRGFGIGAGLKYVGDQFIAEDNNFEIDDYITLDVSGFYQADAWRFRLSLRNIADERYETRGFGSGSVIPAPGVEARGDIEFRF